MLNIQPIPAFDDNYIWLLVDTEAGRACVVDPGDAAPVLSTLEGAGLTLTDILVTHHHYDHVGGLQALCDAYGPEVNGPVNDAIAQVTTRVKAGDTVEVLGHEFSVLEVPGHTLDHIAYFHDARQPLLFCGDTLFAGGCGRVFEGSPPMMWRSLKSLAALPGNTRVYCAHEYTLANLDFASAVEPQNGALRERLSEARQTRERGEPTVPSSLSLELATNPFLRCEQPELLAALASQGRLEGTAPEEVFATVRGWKDNF